ncbi:MAG: Adenosylmethionine--8-amino-7-oxononanoate transaminase [Deltaproteobacteria bacterium]|nr:Adenosylmethionine--8-amino-7-oxononanoate transaminase [Deltaproteobacteria bacterium]
MDTGRGRLTHPLPNPPLEGAGVFPLSQGEGRGEGGVCSELSKVFYSDSGSTSVEIALKIAFQYWQNKGVKDKTRFLTFKNAYHGDTIGSVSLGGMELFHDIYRPLLFQTIQVNSPYCYRCHLGREYPSCKVACIKEVEDTLKKTHNEVAALVIEPLVQGAAGMLVQPTGFLKELRRLCDKYKILMIADEVATGFGRTGKMFACEHEGVVPDILCIAKGITGGYLPLAATLTTGDIHDAFLAEYKEFKTFFHGHTTATLTQETLWPAPQPLPIWSYLKGKRPSKRCSRRYL